MAPLFLLQVMVRVYKRKSARGQYGMDNLHAAISKVSSDDKRKRKADDKKAGKDWLSPFLARHPN